MQEDYCPIRTEEGKCRSNGNKCNHIQCWEKIHYGKPTEAIENKMLKWREHRRGDDKINIEVKRFI